MGGPSLNLEDAKVAQLNSALGCHRFQNGIQNPLDDRLGFPDSYAEVFANGFNDSFLSMTASLRSRAEVASCCQSVLASRRGHGVPPDGDPAGAGIGIGRAPVITIMIPGEANHGDVD